MPEIKEQEKESKKKMIQCFMVGFIMLLHEYTSKLFQDTFHINIVVKILFIILFFSMMTQYFFFPQIIPLLVELIFLLVGMTLFMLNGVVSLGVLVIMLTDDELSTFNFQLSRIEILCSCMFAGYFFASLMWKGEYLKEKYGKDNTEASLDSETGTQTLQNDGTYVNDVDNKPLLENDANTKKEFTLENKPCNPCSLTYEQNYN